MENNGKMKDGFDVWAVNFFLQVFATDYDLNLFLLFFCSVSLAKTVEHVYVYTYI